MSTIALHPVLVDRLVTRSSRLKNAVLIATGAATVGLLAQVSIPLWPVPITGQTLGVMLVGAILGARRGALSLTTYLVLGVIGLPWFANFSGGPASIISPSFGYIIGFIPTAFVIGYLSEKQWDRRPALSMAAFGIASIIPFIVGIPYLWVVLHFAGTTLGFSATLHAGFTPFIIGGIIKWLIGAAVLPGAWTLIERFVKSNEK
ncbi:MAG: biotin transporter BioY [Actinomycetaceae bacterium]|nr:biotin transporter BioY [Actinomycetaceae bacterium]